MSSALYPAFKSNILTKQINMSSDPIHVVLMGAGYTYSTAHTTWGSSGVSTNEAGTQGTYTTGSGGSVLGSSSITVGLSGSTANVTISPVTVSWTGTITAHAAIILDWNSGTPANSQLIAFIDLNALNGGSDPASSGASATFTLDWTSASGIIISLT